MKSKSNLDQTGRAAQVHLREIQLCGKKNKDYNLRRRNATDLLRPMLVEIWDALGRGITVNGCTSKDQWAKWFNPGTKHPDRWIQKIIAGPQKKANSVRFDKIVEGGTYEVNGNKYTVTSILIGQDTEDISSFELIVEPFVEEQTEQKTAPTVIKKRGAAAKQRHEKFGLIEGKAYVGYLSDGRNHEANMVLHYRGIEDDKFAFDSGKHTWKRDQVQWFKGSQEPLGDPKGKEQIVLYRWATKEEAESGEPVQDKYKRVKAPWTVEEREAALQAAKQTTKQEEKKEEQPMRTEIITALVGQGYNRSAAVLAVDNAVGEDFNTLLASALANAAKLKKVEAPKERETEKQTAPVTQKERLKTAKQHTHGVDPATAGNRARTLCELPTKPLTTESIHTNGINCPGCLERADYAKRKLKEIVEQGLAAKNRQEKEQNAPTAPTTLVVHADRPGSRQRKKRWDDTFCGLKGGNVRTEGRNSGKVTCPDCLVEIEKYKHEHSTATTKEQLFAELKRLEITYGADKIDSKLWGKQAMYPVRAVAHYWLRFKDFVDEAHKPTATIILKDGVEVCEDEKVSTANAAD